MDYVDGSYGSFYWVDIRDKHVRYSYVLALRGNWCWHLVNQEFGKRDGLRKTNSFDGLFQWASKAASIETGV